MSTEKTSLENANHPSCLGAFMHTLFIGDIIRDVEDSDCFYEGIVVNVNPIKYKITKIIWCNELDNSMDGEIIELNWWILEKLIDSKWCRLN